MDVCVYVCVCIRLDVNFYSVDFNRTRVKNPFFDWVDAILFYFEFSIFTKLFFAFKIIFNDRVEIFESDG